MGENVTYLGHVDIVPGLNQSEYDYLYALTEPVRDTADNRADGQPSGLCDWEPCPHGCCLAWNGREKFHAGMAWMEFLIDHLLRPGASAEGRADVRLAGFTFDHRMDGLIVGERQWSRELFSIRVENNQVRQEILRRGEPLPWESGWDGLYPEDRPWLAREPVPRRSSLDDPPPEPTELTVMPLLDPGSIRQRSRRRAPTKRS
jgi:hypothetical protein